MNAKDACFQCSKRKAVIRIHVGYELCRPCAEKLGQRGRRAIVRHDLGDDPARYDADTLKRIANGPIMQSDTLYLPAGKLTLAEAEAREAAAIIESTPLSRIETMRREAP